MKSLAKFVKKTLFPLAQKLKIVYKYITFYAQGGQLVKERVL